MPVVVSVILSFLKGVISKYWKVLLVVAVVAGLVYFHQVKVRQYGEQRFSDGVSATLKKMKAEVADRNAVNRDVETRVAAELTAYAARRDRDDKERIAKEQKVANKVATVVDSVPMWKSQECAITDQVLAERNAVRALGPKGEGK